MPLQSAILTSRKVDEIIPLSPTTRWRQEKRGHFPPRFQIFSRKIGYHRAEIDEWLRNPQGWVQQQSKVGVK